MSDASKTLTSWRTPTLVIGFGSLIALIAFGPRSTLGFFLTPLSSANHWGRDVFAFALALQNLLWGIGQALGGIIADRFGSVKVLAAARCYTRSASYSWRIRRARRCSICRPACSSVSALPAVRSQSCLQRSARSCRCNTARSPSVSAPPPAYSGSFFIRRSRLR